MDQIRLSRFTYLTYEHPWNQLFFHNCIETDEGTIVHWNDSQTIQQLILIHIVFIVGICVVTLWVAMAVLRAVRVRACRTASSMHGLDQFVAGVDTIAKHMVAAADTLPEPKPKPNPCLHNNPFGSSFGNICV